MYRVTRNVKQAVHVAEDPPKREETRRLSRCQRRSSAITISTAIHESPGNKYPRTGSPSRFCSSSSIYILRATSYRLHVCAGGYYEQHLWFQCDEHQNDSTTASLHKVHSAAKKKNQRLYRNDVLYQVYLRSSPQIHWKNNDTTTVMHQEIAEGTHTDSRVRGHLPINTYFLHKHTTDQLLWICCRLPMKHTLGDRWSWWI